VDGNQISVMLAELPTHLREAEARMQFMRASMTDAKRAFEAVPASLLQDLSALIPTALSGLAARALFKLATMPGVPFNLFVSNVPGPQLPLYVAGARVEGIFPVSAVTDLTGGLNITLFSYDGALDFGLIACREMVPDVWNLIGYLEDAMAEMVALVPEATSDSVASQVPASTASATKKARTEGAPAKKDRSRRTARRGPGARNAPAEDAVDQGPQAGSGPVTVSAASRSIGKSTAKRPTRSTAKGTTKSTTKSAAAKSAAKSPTKSAAAKSAAKSPTRSAAAKSAAKSTTRSAATKSAAKRPATRGGATKGTTAKTSTRGGAAKKSTASAATTAAATRTPGASRQTDEASAGRRAAKASAKKAPRPRKDTAAKKAAPAPGS
jgi:hypothetical protein